MMLFDTINRFLAPVFITPIANVIGHKVNEKNEANLANNKAA